VSGVFFVVSDWLRLKQELANAKSIPGAIGIAIASIVILAFCAGIVSSVFRLEFNREEYVDKTVNIVTASIFVLYALARERALDRSRVGRCIARYTVLVFILFSFYISCCFENIFLLQDIKDDLATRRMVHEISEELMSRKVVYPDRDKVLEELGEQKGEPIRTGRVQYSKLNDEEFSLSWEYKVPFESHKKIKKLQAIRGYHYYAYSQMRKATAGSNSKTFKLRH
jgi:hypothetical protein